MSVIQKVTPFLWYDHRAREAAEFYCSIFQHAKITFSSEMIVEFAIGDTQFMALNGGSRFKFTEAVSLFVQCEDQAEVDRLWNLLTTDGGEESMCGWCRDKYGLSWQIVPVRFMEMMKTGSPEQIQRVSGAMMSMKKMIIADFEAAFI